MSKYAVGAMIDTYIVLGAMIFLVWWFDFRGKQHRKKQQEKINSSRFLGYEHYKDEWTLILIEKNVVCIVGLVYRDAFNTAEEIYEFLYPNTWLAPYFFDMRIYRADREVLTFVRDETKTREENMARLEEMLFEGRKNTQQLQDSKSSEGASL
jgi:hypothetical protein